MQDILLIKYCGEYDSTGDRFGARNGDILMGVQDLCSRHPTYSKRLRDGIIRPPKVGQHLKVPVTEPATVDSETEVRGGKRKDSGHCEGWF